MSDLISRSYVYKAIGAEPNGACGICKNDRSECMCHSFSKMDICSILDDAPDVDAEPIRHGHWKHIEDVQVCSLCGRPTYDSHDVWMEFNGLRACALVMPHYCGSCGAKMDEEDET